MQLKYQVLLCLQNVICLKIWYHYAFTIYHISSFVKLKGFATVSFLKLKQIFLHCTCINWYNILFFYIFNMCINSTLLQILIKPRILEYINLYWSIKNKILSVNFNCPIKILANFYFLSIFFSKFTKYHTCNAKAPLTQLNKWRFWFQSQFYRKHLCKKMV